MSVSPDQFGLDDFAFPAGGGSTPTEDVVIPGPIRRMAYYRPYPVRRLVPVGIANVTVIQQIVVNHPRVVR